MVDASVAAKWLAPEPESGQAEDLLDGELLVPDLLFPEVANILWKKQSGREMDAATAEAAVRLLLHLPLQVHGCASLASEALSLSIRLMHPAYDCFYLALARQAGCRLVTADRRLFDRCRQPDVPDLVDRVVLLGSSSVRHRHRHRRWRRRRDRRIRARPERSVNAAHLRRIRHDADR